MSPKIRQSYYYLSSAVTAVIGLAVVWGGLKAGSADSLTTILAALGGLLGASGPALAAKKVGDQKKDGVFDTVSPAEQIAQGAAQLNEIIQSTHSQVEQAKDVLTGVLGGVPVLGADLERALDRIKF